MKLIFTIFTLLIMISTSNAQLKVAFPSKDGLTITADWYPENSDDPIILLCHQNRFSRGEYIETAQRLNKLGFNCLAIDQRVGDEVNGVKNETAAEAKKLGKSPVYIDAEQDMLAALDYLFEKYQKKIILFGSSYSASLALKIANENNNVMAVVAFSPGEYFEQKNFIASHVKGLKKPVFITSSKEESAGVTELTKDIESRIKVQYIPKGAGDHGSKVLWSSQKENQDYWAGLISYLNKIKEYASK